MGNSIWTVAYLPSKIRTSSIRRGGFFSPLTMLALVLVLALELSKPTPLPGKRPIGDAPNTGCGPEAEPGQSEFREFER